MPTTSPAKASSATARSWAKKNCGADSVIGLPVRTSFAFIPRWSLPEHTRMKAMRSRWLGSMFAWILKTKPVIFGSFASTARPAASCARGGGADGAERIHQVAHPMIAQRGPEEHRRQVALAESREIEGLQPLAGELDLPRGRSRDRRDWGASSAKRAASCGPETGVALDLRRRAGARCSRRGRRRPRRSARARSASSPGR